MPYVGARDPELLDVIVTSADGFNLTTVTSVEISVRGPKNGPLSWTWSIGSATPTELHLVHTFSANGSDATQEGKYMISGWLVVSPTIRRRIKPVPVMFEKYG